MTRDSNNSRKAAESGHNEREQKNVLHVCTNQRERYLRIGRMQEIIPPTFARRGYFRRLSMRMAMFLSCIVTRPPRTLCLMSDRRMTSCIPRRTPSSYDSASSRVQSSRYAVPNHCGMS